MNNALALNPLQQMELTELAELYEVLGIEAPEDLATGYTQMDEETKGRFVVSGLDQLNWTFRKLAALKVQREKIEALAKTELDRITAWKNKELSGISGTESFMEHLIEDYAQKQRAENPKYAGDKTPYGRVGFKNQVAEWGYDETALVEYLEKNGHEELVRIKKEPDKVTFKKIVLVKDGKAVDQTTGEIVPGVTITERPATVTIKAEA